VPGQGQERQYRAGDVRGHGETNALTPPAGERFLERWSSRGPAGFLEL
jgi:hypothetical protein